MTDIGPELHPTRIKMHPKSKETATKNAIKKQEQKRDKMRRYRENIKQDDRYEQQKNKDSDRKRKAY